MLHCRFLLLSLIFFISACEPESKEIAASPPWRAGSRPSDQKAQERKAFFSLEPHQRLQFSMSSKKKVRVEGSWGLSPTILSLRLDDLSHFETRLSFPFHALRAVKLHTNSNGLRIQRTNEALNWLLVPKAARGAAKAKTPALLPNSSTSHDVAQIPRIQLTNLRSLSTRQAFQGSRKNTLNDALSEQFPQYSHQDDAERLQFRAIKATATLSVLLNQIESQAQQSLTLHFVYSGVVSKQSTPLALILEWGRPLKVLLSEHNLQPRGVDFKVDAHKKASFASDIGQVALLDGPLLFRYRGDKSDHSPGE